MLIISVFLIFRSIGLLKGSNFRFGIRVYRSVVLLNLCPNSSWMKRISVPLFNKSVAKLCGNLFGITFFLLQAINVAFFVLFKSKSSFPKAKQALVAVWFLCSVVRYCRRVMIKTDLGVVFYEVNKKKETPKLLKLWGKMKLKFLVLFLSHLQGKGRVC